MMYFDLSLDLFPLLAGVLAAVGCGLLGNFLVLRKLSLMGDAISHSVLPGLVIAFLITSTRQPFIMFTGAAIAGVVTVLLVELVKKYGKVEPGAAMGVVFSVLFALGVLLIEQAAARQVDLDADCVLHGQLETLVWFSAPDSFGELFTRSTLENIPHQIWTLSVMVLASFLFVGMFFKELRIAAFDPGLATTQGFNSTLMHYLLMIFVAAATVASFEAVGSILVIAMLVCPPAISRLLTDRLSVQIILSVFVSIGCAMGGYFGSTMIPAAFEKDAVSASGSMALMGGIGITLAIVFSPKHGVITKIVRQKKLARSIVVEDLLVTIYRLNESGETLTSRSMLSSISNMRRVDRAISIAIRCGWLDEQSQSLAFTDSGREHASSIVRKHRLWEHYLVDEAGMLPDHVHDRAEQLEHFSPSPPSGPERDPHGKVIP